MVVRFGLNLVVINQEAAEAVAVDTVAVKTVVDLEVTVAEIAVNALRIVAMAAGSAVAVVHLSALPEANVLMEKKKWKEAEAVVVARLTTITEFH